MVAPYPAVNVWQSLCLFICLQELPKLLRGYHKCTVDEAAKLAAYIFRVRYKDDKSKLQSIPYVLSSVFVFFPEIFEYLNDKRIYSQIASGINSV